MGEIVELLAREFASAEAWNWDHLSEDEDTSFGWSRKHIRSHVRDAIEGLREPTAAMIAAAWKNPGDPRRVWRAMIDAALAD